MTIARAPISATRAGSSIRGTDAECRKRATDFLTGVIGCLPDDLRWDETFHLQAHAHLSGHELVVIASRDDAHQPIVLTAMDWDQVRREDANRQQLLVERMICDADHLRVALEHDLVSV